jgi:hypothetical protein
MPDYIKFRETIEYEIQVPANDFEAEQHYGYGFREAGSVKSIAKEVVGRRHETDYVVDADFSRGVYILRADGIEVFADRSHDAVIAKFRELTGSIQRIDLFDDLEDKDKSWP